MMKGAKGTLIKTVDNFQGFHPNGIDEGSTFVGSFFEFPFVGECFYLGSLRTSPVTHIVDRTDKKVTFKTKNSTYELTYTI